jgi:hypothetical protein
VVLVFGCSCNPTHHQRIYSTQSFVFHSLPFPVSTANKYLCNGREKGDGGERGGKKKAAIFDHNGSMISLAISLLVA